MCHEEGDERADAEHRLDNAAHGGGDVHTTKSGGGCIATECGHEIQQCVRCQKDDGQRSVVDAFSLLAFATHK